VVKLWLANQTGIAPLYVQLHVSDNCESPLATRVTLEMASMAEVLLLAEVLCVYKHTYTHTHSPTHTHTYTHTHTHIHTLLLHCFVHCCNTVVTQLATRVTLELSSSAEILALAEVLRIL
jgi:hypothetical protein